MMDWPGMQWDSQSEKDTANQSNADKNNPKKHICQAIQRLRESII